jgi:hypothetical protein
MTRRRLAAAACAAGLALTACSGSGSNETPPSRADSPPSTVVHSSSTAGGSTNPDPGFDFVYDTVTGSYAGGKEWISRGGVSRQIPGHGDTLNNAVPAADGKRLLVMRTDPTSGSSHAVIIDLTGRVERVVPHADGCFPGGFAGQLVVVTCGDSTFHVVAIKPSGATKVLGPDNPGASAAVSPDGRIVLAPDNDTLYTVPITGGTRKVLVRAGNSGDTGAWTGDGKQIAYLARISTAGEAVYLINADGTGRRKVADVPFVGDLHVTVSKDGKHIVVAGSADSAASLWSVGADGSNPHYLSDTLEGGDPHSL